MKSLVEILNDLMHPVVEMAQINTEDSSQSKFPWSKYKLCIYGNDHGPAHFHIISKQDRWDIRVHAITGELVSVKRYGNRGKKDQFTDIIKLAKAWLDDSCEDSDFEGKPNKHMVRIHWNANNPEQKIKK